MLTDNFTKDDIVALLYQKIYDKKVILQKDFKLSKSKIGYFYIDDLLPEPIAKACHKHFPKKLDMRCLKSFREYKYVSAQMDKHHPLLEKVIYAFQDKNIVTLMGEICEIDDLYADRSLYAGGLSLMANHNFLNPHIDNSHDADRNRWRVLNLLYYVTPNWQLQNGGHLELWPHGPKETPILVESKFNRLVIMATHNLSWHSVNKVTTKDKVRCCISNYYFSPKPLNETDKFHVTTYRGRPNERFKNKILEVDGKLRMLVRKLIKKGIRKNPHIYKSKDNLSN